MKALSKAANPDAPDLTARAVFATHSLPGRVFAEAASASDAQKFAASVQGLNPYVIRLVPHQETLSIFNAKNKFTLDKRDWVRLSGKGKRWTVYKGDIGMVVKPGEKTIIVIIPRIKTTQSTERRRPEQSLFPAHILKSFFGENVIESPSHDGSFTFDKRNYTKEGFLFCRLDEVDIRKPADDIPTQNELNTFRECNLISEETVIRTATRIEQLKISSGTRVIIVQGEFRGLTGKVTDVGENEVAVFIESLDQVERLLKSTVRSAFRIGDEVRISSGNHINCVGWVTDVQDQTVTVVNLENDIEVFY